MCVGPLKLLDDIMTMHKRFNPVRARQPRWSPGDSLWQSKNYSTSFTFSGRSFPERQVRNYQGRLTEAWEGRPLSAQLRPEGSSKIKCVEHSWSQNEESSLLIPGHLPKSTSRATQEHLQQALVKRTPHKPAESRACMQYSITYLWSSFKSECSHFPTRKNNVPHSIWPQF